MIRVLLPQHLRTLANVGSEVELEVPSDAQGRITLRAVLDALENRYPTLRGTIRDHDSLKRRPFLRFFALDALDVQSKRDVAQHCQPRE